MPEKNKKKKLLPKKKTWPSKLKVRKHLNADALFGAIHSEFKKIPEFRPGNIDISIPDVLMSAFAMFSLKIPSLLQFDNKRKESAESQNLKTVYGIENIPSDSRMREIGDEINPKKYLSPIFKVPFRHLQRGRALEQMVFYKGCYLLNLDGTGFFSSKKLNAPYCMEKVDKKTRETTYYLQMDPTMNVVGVCITKEEFLWHQLVD